MFDIIELNGKKVAELRQIAGKLGITRLDKLKKQDLVYSILDAQAAQPADKSDKKPAPKGRAKSAKPNDDGAESPVGLHHHVVGLRLGEVAHHHQDALHVLPHVERIVEQVHLVQRLTVR